MPAAKGRISEEELKALVDSGLSTYGIAKKLGRGQTSARYWLNIYGLKTDRTLRRGNHPLSEEAEAGMHELRRSVC